jgi:hypothetical protein
MPYSRSQFTGYVFPHADMLLTWDCNKSTNTTQSPQAISMAQLFAVRPGAAHILCIKVSKHPESSKDQLTAQEATN